MVFVNTFFKLREKVATFSASKLEGGKEVTRGNVNAPCLHQVGEERRARMRKASHIVLRT